MAREILLSKKTEQGLRLDLRTKLLLIFIISIFVIDNGQIAQQGTHEELLKQSGIYQDFVNIRKSAAGWSLA